MKSTSAFIHSLGCASLALSILGGGSPSSPASTQPIVGPDILFEEINGLVAVEAEYFSSQEHTGIRAWHLSDESGGTTEDLEDGDPGHAGSASGGACLEILPDTRRTHDNKLIPGENFSNQPGKLGVLSYPVYFNNPGRYYVWVRAYSTGTEDNGIHVGLNNAWPESGKRMQWCDGKNSWRWESLQRTDENHCGEPHKIYLDIPSPGRHVVHFSMREDGFEFDKFLMTMDRNFQRPTDAGPGCVLRQGHFPEQLASAGTASGANRKPFPPHWGDPPAIQTRDYRPLPGGYGMGSSTLAAWIRSNMQKDSQQRPDGDATVRIEGESRQWHKVTLNLNGPFASETDTDPNPFLDYRFAVRFAHESGSPVYLIPGYFAGDGSASESSATSGSTWRAHLSPDKAGQWSFQTVFLKGEHIAVDGSTNGVTVAPWHGITGVIRISPSDKLGRDFRAHGRLQYVGRRYLKFAGSGKYFLKAGADAPETLLAYSDFDGTTASKANAPLKTWAPHTRDWKTGDPTWQNGKGKGLIGALNYLASTGANAFSFLPYNAGGDGDNVWPFVSRDDKLHYDISKLDQWGVVFDHATSLGLYLHFKLQENEIDDNRRGQNAEGAVIPEALDGGRLGTERKLYCRELVARFAHNLALNWNIGEENTQSTSEIIDMAEYIRAVDPYDHHIVIHTFPNQQDKVYTPLLGPESPLTGASLQNHWDVAHQRTLKWIEESEAAGKTWVVANDEQGSANFGVPPDPGFEGFSGVVTEGRGRQYDLHDIRKYTLWGTLMAGGAGVEYYFGYQLPQNDLKAENWRSRDRSWHYCHVALQFFADHAIPFQDMKNHNQLVGNPENSNSKYCMAMDGRIYLVYLPQGGTAEINLNGVDGVFDVHWYDTREGGELQEGTVRQIRGGNVRDIGLPPAERNQDWLAFIRLAE